jgi:hypothetical protein
MDHITERIVYKLRIFHAAMQGLDVHLFPRVIAVHEGTIRCMSLSNVDPEIVLTCGDDRLIRVWDLRTGACMALYAGHKSVVTWCRFTPGDHFVVSCSFDTTIKVWDSKSERMLVNLAIPLATGGVFCTALLYHELPYLVAPAMLVFYGCALLNASKYTVSDIRYLGILEIILGLFVSFYLDFGLLAWTLGFGVLHIVYGTLVYFKYER